MINDDDFKIFPVRFGGSVGKALENKMLDAVGGANSIRTRIIGNTMLRTRGGFPEFTTLKEPVIIESASRTFVFRNIGATTGVVANKNGIGMKVVVTSLPIGVQCYSVGSINTSQTKWRDVFRVNDAVTHINGKAPPDIVSVPSIPDVDAANLPIVLVGAGGYQPTCTGDATRSTLFIGHVKEGAFPSVTSITTAGAQKQKMIASDISGEPFALAGAWFISGKFNFYGATVYRSGDIIKSVIPRWATIEPTLTSPYLAMLASLSPRLYLSGLTYNASVDDGVAVTVSPVHNKSNYVHPITKIPFYTTATLSNVVAVGGGQYTFDYVYDQLKNLEDSDYVDTGVFPTTRYSDSISLDHTSADSVVLGYSGSRAQMNYTTSIVLSFSGSKTIGGKHYSYVSGGSSAFYSGGSANVGGGTSHVETNLVLSSPSVGEVFKMSCVVDQTSTFDYSTSPTIVNYGALYGSSGSNPNIYGQWFPPENYTSWVRLNASEISLNPRTVKDVGTEVEFSVETKDYVFADVGEQVYLYLAGKLTVSQVRSEAFGGVISDVKTYNLSIRYVLDIRGEEYFFDVFNGNAFSAPVINYKTIFATDTNYEQTSQGNIGWYHVGYKPIPVFSPLFMDQGNCPFIAYTTQAEELSGATPEFYIDASLSVRTYESFSGSRYDSAAPFVPHQLLKAFRVYVCGEDVYSSPALKQNTGLWDSIFPADTPFRVQFANGTTGPWQGQLGTGFSNGSQVEISRI